MKVTVALLLGALLALSAPVSRVFAAESASDDVEVEDEAPEAGYDEEDGDDDLNAELKAHNDVLTAAIFPKNPERRVQLARDTLVVASFSNTGGEAFTILGMGAHLHNPHDFSFHVQNFTARRVEGAVVGPSQEASVEYVFRTDESLEYAEYGFTAWVIYNTTSGRTYRSTVYNGTVDVVSNGEYNFSGFFTTLIVLGSLAALFVWNRNVNNADPKRRATKEETARSAEKFKSEVESLVYTPAARSRSRK